MLYLSHHISKKHPQMPIFNRAAQFAPFAALTGHDAAMKETARLTDTQIELNEDYKEKINERLKELVSHIADTTQVSLLYFVPDTKKDGGFYTNYTGFLKKIDLYKRMLLMQDGTSIYIDRIIELTEIDTDK